MNIIYFLEDDTVSVMEPPVDNAGFMQGKLVSRGKIVKNVKGDLLHWKDFNVGIDVCTFHKYLHRSSLLPLMHNSLSKSVSANSSFVPEPYVPKII